MVGFNNLSYDYPLLHHMINHYEEYKHLDGQTLAQKLYEKSQEIIEAEFSIVSEKNTKIPQIDVYKINHWDNPAKACSLKHCEMAMRMNNIEEMPLHHTHWVTTEEEINIILDYNKHDVAATNVVFDYTLGKTDHAIYKGKNKLALRQLLSKTFGINLLNHNDVKIGEDLVFALYAKHSGIPEYVLKKQRTPRPIIHLKDCIPSYINFKTPKFNSLLNEWKRKSIYTTKKALSNEVIFHGILLEYGTGGIHGSNSGVFESDKDFIIIDSDVGLSWAQLKSN